MSTQLTEVLSGTLFGKTRRSILSLLYGHADESFYLRQIARATGIGLGSVQRELRQLTDAGIICRTVRGHQVDFQANKDSPIFPELKGIITKTAGVSDTLRNALSPLADRIKLAFVYGSVASASETKTSDIDVMVVGDVSFSEVVTALQSAQETLRREINPTVYPPSEFKGKLSEGSPFIKDVMDGQKIFLIGDQDELNRLVA